MKCISCKYFSSCQKVYGLVNEKGCKSFESPELTVAQMILELSRLLGV